MSPDIVEPGKIGRVVAFGTILAPEEDGLIRKGGSAEVRVSLRRIYYIICDGLTLLARPGHRPRLAFPLFPFHLRWLNRKLRLLFLSLGLDILPHTTASEGFPIRSMRQGLYPRIHWRVGHVMESLCRKTTRIVRRKGPFPCSSQYGGRQGSLPHVGQCYFFGARACSGERCLGR